MLEHLLKQGPNQTLAFLPEADVDVLSETLVAFANAEGGTIILGVNLQGQPTGQIRAEDVEIALTQAIPRCRPPVMADWSYDETAKGSIVTLRVSRSPELHALADGRVLVRYRTQNQPLNGEAIRHLAATKSAGDFEIRSVAGTSLLDLDKHVVEDYLTKRIKRSNQDLTIQLEDHLVEMGAMHEDGPLTVMGLLLFGKHPHIYLPQSGIIFVKFQGKEPRGRDGKAGYQRRVEVKGPSTRIIEQVWQIIWEEMKASAEDDGLKREEQPAYPSFAVREALVNAICHRDYRLSGRKVEVRLYEDRLEVISPGGLPGYMTLDNLVEEHFSRNPRLVSGLFEWGYVEALGLGIDRMIEEMLQQGYPPPEFKATPYSFTVKFYNVQERPSIQAWHSNMNERQIKAMSFIEKQKRITNRDYQSLCPDVTPETLRLDLVDLVDRGLLLKIGDKKGTYYILK